MCLFCQPGYRLIIDCVSADRRSEPSPPIGLFRAFIGPSTLHPTSISFGLCELLLYGLACLILPWQPCCFFCLTKPRGDDAWVLRTSTNMQTAKARRTPKLRSPALCCLVPFFSPSHTFVDFLNMVEGITSNMTKIPERALVCCRFALPKKKTKKKKPRCPEHAMDVKHCMRHCLGTWSCRVVLHALLDVLAPQRMWHRPSLDINGLLAFSVVDSSGVSHVFPITLIFSFLGCFVDLC